MLSFCFYIILISSEHIAVGKYVIVAALQRHSPRQYSSKVYDFAPLFSLDVKLNTS